MPCLNRSDNEVESLPTCCFSVQTAHHLRLFWEITHKCNLNCVHCCSSEDAEKELGTDDLFRIARSCVQNNVGEVIFTGGEPLMRQDFLKIAQYTKSLGLEIVLCTNGTTIDSNVAENLKRLSLKAVYVSLDGANAQTHDNFRGVDGSFESTLKGMKMLRNNNIPVVISTVIHKENYGSIDKIVELGIGLRTSVIKFYPLLPGGRGKKLNREIMATEYEYEQALNTIEEEKKFHGEKIRLETRRIPCRSQKKPLQECPAAKSVVLIAPDGSLSPCPWLYKTNGLKFNQIDFNENDSFAHALIEMEAYIQDIKEKRANSFCKTCHFSDVCGRGCLAFSRNCYPIGELDPMCFRMQK